MISKLTKNNSEMPQKGFLQRDASTLSADVGILSQVEPGQQATASQVDASENDHSFDVEVKRQSAAEEDDQDAIRKIDDEDEMDFNNQDDLMRHGSIV